MKTLLSKSFFILLCVASLSGGTTAQADPSSPVTTLYLVRHGETEWNRLGKMQGSSDIPLNESGRTQAQEVQKGLQGIAFDAVYSSPLERAIETAQILSEGQELPIMVDQRLIERSFGPWEGGSYEAYRTATEDQLVGVESDNALKERVSASLMDIVTNHEGECILATAHGGVVKSALRWILEENCEIQVKNVGYAVLTYSDGKWSVGKLQGVIFFDCMSAK